MFFHRLFNPHCEHCIEERVCKTCEVLKFEVDRLRSENERLLNRILEKPVQEIERTVAPEPVSTPRVSLWSVKKQMLEAEDRAKAQILKKAAKPDNQSVDGMNELESELLNAQINREAESR